MLKKNDMATVTITDMGVGGEGIGKIDGYTLFVKDAVIGDVVNVKVMKAKKTVWLCAVDGNYYTIRRPCRTGVSCGSSVWRMPDSGAFI